MSRRKFRLYEENTLPNQSLCTCHFERPKLKISEFGVRKVLLIEKAPTRKMGDLMVPQIHLACWTRLKVFKGLGGTRYVEVLVGQVLIGGPWNLAIHGTRTSTPDLPGQ